MSVRIDESLLSRQRRSRRAAQRVPAGTARISLGIRRLGYADLSRVMEIERRSFPAPWSLAMFVLELSKPTSICLGATHSGELIGYLVCSRYHTVWHVMNVAVDPAYRRLRVATALIERLLEETDGSGERYTLEVRVSNAEAIRMYESFGFRRAGVRRRYYHDNNEDAMIMWRTSDEEAVAPKAARVR